MADLMTLIHEAGFKGQAANIMYAIVMAESGGSATAHNTNAGTGDNSYGLAQINMLGSMGPARLKEYGLKSNEDLFDPLTNLKVAYKMSGGGTHFGDWSTYNSGAYQQYLGQSGAVVKNGNASAAGAAYQPPGGAGGGSALPAMTADDYMGVDGLGKLLKSIPELSTLVDQAVSGNWSTQKFQNAVEESKWYKTHSNTARSIIAQQMNDPASYKQTLYKTQQTVQKLAQQLGIPLGDGRLQNIASYALLSGHDSDQQWLTDQLFYGRDWRKITDIGQLNGGMANTAQQLQQLASSYGFQWTAPQIASYAQKILDGQTTIDTYKGDLVQWAKSAFPSLAKSLDAGQTVLDAAAPYMQSMSQLLEVDPSQLSLFTPAIRKALQGTQDPKTQERTAVPLWQFEDQVRQDPRWQYTQNAKDTVSSALVQLGATFGFGPQG